ncbi:putative PGI1-glucose-6-phosphate isomerase [Ceraceosorus guamensis]|uniref:Glucose-6-phosphate isomerase n=1 Tax=Ceraceosorus guamensis TaxID=1522189 RepID=A0A316W480_9BASI|nr:putative PGI1-glucose-6-phosphate isomerase [Ceraceosorus guamensis]PWN44354.1 putative PGI1-glucose-6-phosphate isomerase [Ceraceosorus guamensis]
MTSNHLATELPSWSKLQQLHDTKGAKYDLRQAFKADPKRFEKYSEQFKGTKTDASLLVDYSKNLIDDEVLKTLLDLAREAKVEEQRDAMYAGVKVNSSEGRSVLHIALRDLPEKFKSKAEGVDEVKPELEHIKAFSDAVRSGSHKGYSGKQIKSIVNIGIGGSNLGPLMVTQALKPYAKKDLEAHYVSNIDGTHLAEALRACDPETTVFIIASKTFTTQETITNANSARDWFLKTAKDESHISKHFVALSTNVKEATAFGIDKANMFKFWDWVGGRYSLWSAIGLSIAIVIGYENFEQLLLGAHELDVHFKEAPLEKNIPVLLATIGIWYNNFFDAQSYAQLPYDQYMHRFAAYFQQASMESLGKGVTKNGKRVDYQTGEVLWGEPGTDGQHAFYQLIHQGTKLIPCDFIAPIETQNPLGKHHDILLSNFFAQPEALAFGKTAEEAKGELSAQDQSNDFLIQSKIFTGNRPTNSILAQKITPATLGALIALYEHKIAVQGFIWNVNAYDQFGVELGKVLAKKILPALEAGDPNKPGDHDSSTSGLISYYLKNRKGH